MGTNLPTGIDAEYPDRSPGDAAHQQHHDAIHAYTNAHDAAVDPHGDRAYADGAFELLGPPLRGARLRHSVAQAVANGTWTTLAFDGETTDTHGFHDTVTNNPRITVPAGLDGYYLVIGDVPWASGGAARRWARLMLNGVTNLYEDNKHLGVADFYRNQLVTERALVAGDYLTLQAFQNTGAALDVTAACRLTALRIGV